jgi:hypothetical protein
MTLTTIRISTEITAEREVRITLPADTPLGQAEIVVVIAPQTAAAPATLGDLRHSEFFGMWRDREDIADSVAFARQLRTDAWKRGE